ncbi:MAG: hypothetical protein JXA36_03895 [Coriobacteriia bacterium]|nr:hypothetical protein [Coriobacteriia bacterium]
MSQRSYGNDRNRKGAKVGSTRKSAARAKPVRKQGTVEASTSSAKPKKAGQDKDWSGLPTSPEIKKWRRVWWVLLLGGMGAIAISYVVPELRNNDAVLRAVSGAVIVLSVAAVTIDLVVIRKLRKELMEKTAKKKSSKHDGKDAS